MNNNCSRRFKRSLDQEPDDTPLTMSLEEAVSFGYRERSLQTHGTVVVVDLYKVYTGSAQSC